MDELTDAQRETLKTLPVAFLAKLRAAVVRKRELDEQWATEEERVSRLREMIQDWKTKHEQTYATAMASIHQRLQDSQASVSQSIAHVDRTKQLQLTNLDEQITRRKGEIEKIDEQIKERQARIEETKASIAELHDVMEKKRQLLQALSMGNFTPRRGGNLVSRRPAMTLYKSDGQTYRPSSAMPGNNSWTPSATPRTPTSAREALEEDTNEGPDNSPETAISIGKVDIDTVPARVVLESLQELILEPTGFLVQCLGPQVRPNEQDKLGRAWVDIFASNGEFMSTLRWMVEREVEATQEIGTLFRSNSMASRMMSAFSRSIGMDYIKSLLKPKIDAIIAAKEDLEIDTMKIIGDQTETPQRDAPNVSPQLISSNITKLTEHAIDFIQTIMAGKARAPLEFYQIANLLKDVVSKKFPTQWNIAIGGYLFLRLMCPCIFLPPEDFGYNFETVAPEAKRTLVLVSKILQNLANLQPKFVEEIMSPFSQFVTFNMPAVAQYFEYMTNIPTSTQPTALPEFPIRQRLREVLGLAASNYARLAPVLSAASATSPSPAATEELVQLWTFSKAPKLLTIYNKLTQLCVASSGGIGATTAAYPEDAADVIAFLDLLVPPAKEISPIMKTGSRQSVVAALPIEQLTNPPEEPHVLLAVLETSTRLDFSAVENAELAAALFPLWNYRGRAVELIRYALDIFSRFPTKSNRPLLDSVAAKCFALWAQHMLPLTIKNTLAPAVVNLGSKVESLNQRETSLEVSTVFVTNILNALPELPDPILQTFKLIANSPSFGLPSVIEMLYTQIWMKPLEDPESYSLPTGGGDRLIKKALLNVADNLSLIAVGGRDKQNAAVDFFLTSSHVKTVEAVKKWLESTGNKKTSNATTIPWSSVSTALDSLRMFIGKNMSTISAILENTTSQSRYVKFTVAQAIEQMVKHTAAKK